MTTCDSSHVPCRECNRCPACTDAEYDAIAARVAEQEEECKRLVQLYEDKREEWIAKVGGLERENAAMRQQLGLATEGGQHGAD